MKRGDSIPVTIEGQVVTQATVEQVEADRVTLIVPATRVVMGVVTRLAPNTTEPSKETVVDEVVRPEATTEAPTAETPTVESSTPVEGEGATASTETTQAQPEATTETTDTKE